VWFFYRLRKGGYPFDKDDLDIETWRALAEMEDALATVNLEVLRRKRG
jgi:hypothetical protein